MPVSSSIQRAICPRDQGLVYRIRLQDSDSTSDITAPCFCVENITLLEKSRGEVFPDINARHGEGLLVNDLQRLDCRSGAAYHSRHSSVISLPSVFRPAL